MAKLLSRSVEAEINSVPVTFHIEYFFLFWWNCVYKCPKRNYTLYHEKDLYKVQRDNFSGVIANRNITNKNERLPHIFWTNKPHRIPPVILHYLSSPLDKEPACLHSLTQKKWAM